MTIVIQVLITLFFIIIPIRNITDVKRFYYEVEEEFLDKKHFSRPGLYMMADGGKIVECRESDSRSVDQRVEDFRRDMQFTRKHVWLYYVTNILMIAFGCFLLYTVWP